MTREAAFQRLRIFSLVRRRIRDDVIGMNSIMHGLLDFPCDVVFAALTRSGLRGPTFKIHQQRCETRRHQHALSVGVVVDLETCVALANIQPNEG